MEIFGIIFSIPVAFVASLLYWLFLVELVSKSTRVTRWLLFTSYIVLLLFSAELIILAILGAVRVRGLLGPGFYVAHICFFFLGTPALANSLVLRPGGGFFTRWYVATVLCTAFAVFLVLLQYSVSESLYGINGDDGPYSKPPSSTNQLRPLRFMPARSSPCQTLSE